jgi:translation initiation factor IF-3
LIGAEGEQIGIVSNRAALQMALDVGLDLVEIAPNAIPPVCRLMDYKKYLFEQNKQKHSAKKKQRKSTVKEMSFRPNTDVGDYDVKLKKITGFLDEGDKVKISLRYRGREMSHQELGFRLIEKLKGDLEAHASIEQAPKLEGRQVIMLVGPKKK